MLNSGQKASAGIVAAMVVWLVSGDLLTQDAIAGPVTLEAVSESKGGERVPVRGERSQAVAKPVTLDVLGQTQADRKSTLRTPVTS